MKNFPVVMLLLFLAAGCGSGTAMPPPFLFEGDGTFTELGSYSAGAMVFAQSPVIGDFNGDGIPDVATTGGQIQTISYLYGTGTGSLTPLATPQVVLPNNPRALIVGDFDGNGFDDLATYPFFTDAIQVVLSKAGGVFDILPLIQFPANMGPNSIVAGRFDAGPTIDIVASVPTGLQALLGNGDGTFAPQPIFATALPPVDLVAADFSGDGFLDVAGRLQPARNVAWGYLGDGAGDFGSSFEIESDGSSITAKVLDLYPVDVNGDGRIDALLRVSDGPDRKILVALNIEGRTRPEFVLHPFQFRSNSSIRGAALGDFNSDGVPDVVLTLETPAMQILLGTGSGGMDAAVPPAYTVDETPTRPAVADLDRDGALDIVTTGETFDEVTVHLGNRK